MATPPLQCFEFGPFRLDPAERQLLRDGQPVPLTPKAFDALLIFVENSNRLLGKDELIAKLWPDSFVEESNLAQNVSTLRRALGEQPDGRQYIETVPKRGYRFIAEVRLKQQEQPFPAYVEMAYPARAPVNIVPVAEAETVMALVAPSFEAEAEDPPPEKIRDTQPFPKAHRRFGRTTAVAGIALFIVAAIGCAYLYSGSSWLRGTSGNQLAVLPFRNLQPDASTDFLGFSLADAVITKLNYVSSITVRPSAYVDKYRNQQVDPQRVARELQVDKLLTGTYVKEGDDLRINLQLIDVTVNRVLWSESLNLKYEKLLTIQDRVTREVIGRLSLTLTPAESEQVQSRTPRDSLAYEFHLRGVDLYHQDELRTAISMLEQAVDIDPDYALSWSYLGTINETLASLYFGGRDSYYKARQAYDKALALDPTQIEARIFTGAFLTNTGRVEQAVPVLRSVIQTNPNLSQAHWELGYAYRFGGLLRESIAEGERARQIDNVIRANNSVFNGYLYDGQYDKFLQGLPSGESSAFITFYRGLGAYYLKDWKQTAAYFDRAYEMNPSLMPVQAGKALSYALAGENPQGIALLQKTEKMIVESGVSDAEGIYKVAQAFAVLGDKPSALRVLRQSIEGGFFCYPYFVNDALLANLHGDPEFAALMETARRRHEEFKRQFSSR